MADLPDDLRDLDDCWLTTTGRVTARRHTTELWFVPSDGGVFLMSGSGGLRQWCLDLVAEEQAVLRIGDDRWQVRSALLADDDPVRTAALELFHAKYDRDGRDRLAAWLDQAAVFRLVLIREIVV